MGAIDRGAIVLGGEIVRGAIVLDPINGDKADSKILHLCLG